MSNNHATTMNGAVGGAAVYGAVGSPALWVGVIAACLHR